MSRIVDLGGRGELSPSIASAPTEQAAAGVVLGPADLGPDFVVATGGERTRFGFSGRVQTLVRAGRLGFVEPDGIYFVRSFALVAPDVRTADRVFDQSGGELFNGLQEVPVPAIGDRARGAIEWGNGPFDLAVKIVMFRARSVVGYVVVASYEAPASMDDIVPLAQTMVEKALQ